MPNVLSPFAQIQDSLPPLTPQPFDPMAMVGGDQSLPAFPSSKPAPKVNLAKFNPATASPQELAENPLVSRLRSDETKDLHPWGTPENHPGFLGKLGHALSWATGGPNRRMAEEMGLQKSLQNLLGEQAKNEEENAITGKTKEETAEMPAQSASEKGLRGAQKANLESETRDRDANAAMGPSLIMGHAHAVNQAIAAGRDPAQDPIVLQYEDAIQRIQKDPAATKGIVTDLKRGGTEHNVLVNPATGQEIRDLGEKGEKAPMVRIETPHERFGEKQSLLKLYEPAQDSAERFNVMAKNYEEAIRNHDQQAMLSLLANHLGMTMGLQKGARMTRDIIREAEQSRPWLQGMGAKFDKDGYLTGVTLTPQQMRQMVNLGRERFKEDMVKANNEAGYMGATEEGPARTPSISVKNHYLGLANGDKNKALQLMAEDGWTVPNAR